MAERNGRGEVEGVDRELDGLMKRGRGVYRCCSPKNELDVAEMIQGRPEKDRWWAGGKITKVSYRLVRLREQSGEDVLARKRMQ